MFVRKNRSSGRGPGSEAVSRYLADLSRIPFVDNDEQEEIAERIRGGEREAANRLVEASLGFVVKVASEYRNCGLPFEDLVNEGNVGLVEAAQRYDPDRGTKFITYAVWWIRKSILRALSERKSVVRMSESRERRLRNVRKVEDRLRQELGRSPSRHEIAEHLLITPIKLERLLQHSVTTVSLDLPTGGDAEIPLVDRLEAEQESAEERVSRAQLGRIFARAFSTLGSRQQMILILRAGLDGEPPRTLREVGERVKISRERVRQIELEAKNRLRVLVGRALRT